VTALPSPETVDASLVTLTVPADPRFLRLARLVVAGLAAEADLTVDDIDDLRVAVDEVGAALMEPDGAAEVELRFAASDDEIAIEGRRRIAGDEVPDLHPVARGLLEATTDELSITVAQHVLSIAVTKRAHAPGA